MGRLRWQVDRVNRRGPSIGLVMSYVTENTVLQASGYFRPWLVQPFLDLYGPRFHIGSIRGVNVIYALTEQRTLNAAVTVQTLLDVFSVSGIVHYGAAGSCNDSVSFQDVSDPKLVA
uniref:Nucleoside phosphorylase domain-containing protein n=1 Tax=Triticum urartu TaxID=4572 RepID=A0A8R7QYZ6_TRIUA